MTLANQPPAGSGASQEAGALPRRSWWSLLRRKSPPAGPLHTAAFPTPGVTPPAIPTAQAVPRYRPNPPPKPPLFVADLLMMSTLDQKAPPATPGANDLLESLVHDHLDRAAARPGALPVDPAEAAPEDSPAAPSSSPPPLAQRVLSAAESAELLQREIEALLAGDPSADAAVERAPATVEPFVAQAPATSAATRAPAHEAPPAADSPASAPEITQAELDVLLEDADTATPPTDAMPPADAPATSAGQVATPPAQPASAASSVPTNAQATPLRETVPAPVAQATADARTASAVPAEPPLVAAPPAATPISPAHAPAADDVEARLTEAEGVMAEELAQLMAETQAAESSSSPGADLAAATIERSAGGHATEVVAPENLAVTPENLVPAELSAAVQSIMDNPPAAAAASPTTPGAQTPPPAPAAVASVSTPAPSAPAALVQLSATAVGAPSTSPAVAPPAAAASPRATVPSPVAGPPAPAAPPPAAAHTREPTQIIDLDAPSAQPGFFLRFCRLCAEPIIMILQIIDMPFGWITEPDKNVIGIAAFCLLMGGIVIYAWSLWLGYH